MFNSWLLFHAELHFTDKKNIYQSFTDGQHFADVKECQIHIGVFLVLNTACL